MSTRLYVIEFDYDYTRFNKGVVHYKFIVCASTKSKAIRKALKRYWFDLNSPYLHNITAIKIKENEE